MNVKSKETVLPQETFRVQPYHDAPDFLLVYVFSTLAEMRAAMRDWTGYCHPGQLACCVSCTGKDPNLVGLLFFSSEQLGAGLVAHEMAHAAFRAIERAGRTVTHVLSVDAEYGAKFTTDPSEEAFCHVLEHLVANFWREYYDLGLGRPSS